MNKIDLSEEIASKTFLWSAYTLDPNRIFCLFAKRPTATRPFPCFLLSLFQVFPFTNDRENMRRTTNYKRPKVILCFPKYSLLALADLRYISFRAFKSTFCVSLRKSKTQRLSIEPYRNLPKRHPLIDK